MFVRATYYREKKTVHYFDENDEETLYIGGSFAWRTNNPGNMAKPHKRVVSNVIGYAQRTSSSNSLFLIFQDKDSGEKARVSLLREVYGNSSIAAMMERYAPRPENDTDEYIKFICDRVNVPKTTVVNQMSDAQFKAMVAAMEKKEGYLPGKIVKLGKAKNVELRDMVQQPIAGKTIHLQSGESFFSLKTDNHGGISDIYPNLLNDDLSLFFGNPLNGSEKIGSIAPDQFSTDLTFVAPYFLSKTKAREHEVETHEEPIVHIVGKNDTLTSIGEKYGFSAEAIAKENNIKDVNKIFERQHLRIPKKGSGSSGSPPKPAAAKPSHSDTAPKETKNSTKPGGASERRAEEAAPTQRRTVNTAPAVSVDHQRTDRQHPVTILSSPTLTPSGRAWCQKYLGSNSLDSLNSSFQPKARAFIGELTSKGIGVAIRAAYRPIERSYLMYYAFKICKGMDVTTIPPYAGIDIDWAHRDADGTPNIAAAKAAAEEMCRGYSINPRSERQQVGMPGSSRHNYAAAVDMNITNYIGKTVKDATGNEVHLRSFSDLTAVGRSYGVKYYPRENMHWSDRGT
ncbi:LysM peptidoglycan-binding domain-containing protein [Rugamonas sp. FT107W]|uniref:LysM peptidoglycan-binding domain-containing protein n=1 Tax=Duganella vulcania TaxID=2692166 RepID=A0A845HVB4_9BURK|nr:LysM peptidoglycan-binding domain-containing protein [Duganella vulcania]MYN20306.1 LysM peptidoglycan-binding domain-containing protein [Duganella vulcania]